MGGRGAYFSLKKVKYAKKSSTLSANNQNFYVYEESNNDKRTSLKKFQDAIDPLFENGIHKVTRRMRRTLKSYFKYNFVEINKKDIVNHVYNRHNEDYEEIKMHFRKVLNRPQLILKDKKSKRTIILGRKIGSKKHLVIVLGATNQNKENIGYLNLKTSFVVKEIEKKINNDKWELIFTNRKI